MLNKCEFIGFLGKDVDIRSTQDGREIANLSLGVSESYKDKSGERVSKTEWIKIAIFNENLVKVAKNYLKKGSKVYIEGKMQTRKWTDKEGKDNYSTEVVLQGFNGTIVLLDSKGSDEPKPVEKPQAIELNDEIPF